MKYLELDLNLLHDGRDDGLTQRSNCPIASTATQHTDTAIGNWHSQAQVKYCASNISTKIKA